MSESNTTSAIVEQLTNSLSNVEAEVSSLAGGVRAVVPEEEVGQAFRVLRKSEYEFESARDPSSKNVTFNIKAEDSDD